MLNDAKTSWRSDSHLAFSAPVSQRKKRGKRRHVTRKKIKDCVTMLSEGRSVASIAKDLDMSEGSVHLIKKGGQKKMTPEEVIMMEKARSEHYPRSTNPTLKDIPAVTVSTHACTVEVEIRNCATLKLRGNIEQHFPVLIETLLRMSQ